MHARNPLRSDVLIIGGGLAGLASAHALSKSGLSVALLEARERFGGRAYGERWEPADRMIDIGGTWLLPGFSRTFEALEEFGIETVESPDSEIWLTHFREGPENRKELNEKEYNELKDALQRLGKIVQSSDVSISAEDALRQTTSETPDLIEDWMRAMQRYLAGAPLEKVDAEHLLLDPEDVADPEHYLTQIAGTTDALTAAFAKEITGKLHMNSPVSSINSFEDGFVVVTQGATEYQAKHLVIAVPLNVLSSLEVDTQLFGSYSELALQGHVGASRKDWLILDGIADHFRVFASHGPYGYFRSEAVLADGGLLCVGLVPELEETVDDEKLEKWIRELYFSDARIRTRYSHDWNEDPHSKGAWFVPRPGQYAMLEKLKTGHENVHVIGGDVDLEFPGTIEGAIRSGQKAAHMIIKNEEVSKSD